MIGKSSEVILKSQIGFRCPEKECRIALRIMKSNIEHFTVVSFVVTCLVIFTLFCIITKLVRRRHICKQASKFPGPPTLPIIGNAHLFIGNTEAILDRFIQLGKLYPAPYRLWFGNYLTFVVNNPKQFKVILLSPKTIDKGDLFEFALPWLGTGLLTASGEKWRIHRKLLQPTFRLAILKSFVKVFVARSVKMANELEQNLDKPEFDIENYISQYTLHSICETTMGVNLGDQINGENLYAETMKKVIVSMCKRSLSPWLHSNFIFDHTQIGKDQRKNIEFLHAFTDNVIQAKHKQLSEKGHRPYLANHEDDSGNGIQQRKVLLDHLIEVSRDSKILSDKELREEVDTIMAAGSDTTAMIVSYAMLMLASHPEVQEKVYQELCEIFEDDENEDVTPEDLACMTYMERVIKETMRLFPIAPFLIRSVMDDLDIGDHTLPAGSTIFLSMLELHRNGDIWPEPLKFDPDRFLPEKVKERESYTYLPFSGGLRGCIGLRYAMMSMKTLLSTIIRRYVLKKDNIIPVKDLRFKAELLMRPVNPIKIRIEKRTRNAASIRGS